MLHTQSASKRTCLLEAAARTARQRPPALLLAPIRVHDQRGILQAFGRMRMLNASHSMQQQFACRCGSCGALDRPALRSPPCHEPVQALTVRKRRPSSSMGSGASGSCRCRSRSTSWLLVGLAALLTMMRSAVQPGRHMHFDTAGSMQYGMQLESTLRRTFSWGTLQPTSCMSRQASCDMRCGGSRTPQLVVAHSPCLCSVLAVQPCILPHPSHRCSPAPGLVRRRATGCGGRPPAPKTCGSGPPAAAPCLHPISGGMDTHISKGQRVLVCGQTAACSPAACTVSFATACSHAFTRAARRAPAQTAPHPLPLHRLCGGSARGQPGMGVLQSMRHKPCLPPPL